MLGIGLAALGSDYDCAHVVVICLSHVEMSPKYGGFPSELVGNTMDYGELHLDDG
jgi:hypothetical protein